MKTHIQGQFDPDGYFLDARNKFLIMLPKTGFTFVVAPHIIEVHLTVAPANKISSLLKVLQVVAE